MQPPWAVLLSLLDLVLQVLLERISLYQQSVSRALHSFFFLGLCWGCSWGSCNSWSLNCSSRWSRSSNSSTDSNRNCSSINNWCGCILLFRLCSNNGSNRGGFIVSFLRCHNISLLGTIFLGNLVKILHQCWHVVLLGNAVRIPGSISLICCCSRRE